MLSSLVASLDDKDDVALSDGSGPKVHFQSLLRFRRPATGVSGQESLSDSEESRLSPIRGPLGRGELSREEKAELERVGGERGEGTEAPEALVLMASTVAAGASDSSEDVVASEEVDDSRWACALACKAESVYFTVLISSSSGVRNETLFLAGNSGLADAILREVRGAGPFVRMERRLCGCL